MPGRPPPSPPAPCVPLPPPCPAPSLKKSPAKNPRVRLCQRESRPRCPPCTPSLPVPSAFPSPVFVLFKLHQKCHRQVSRLASKLPDKFQGWATRERFSGAGNPINHGCAPAWAISYVKRRVPERHRQGDPITSRPINYGVRPALRCDFFILSPKTDYLHLSAPFQKTKTTPPPKRTLKNEINV